MLGPYGGPRQVGVYYERGTPVQLQPPTQQARTARGKIDYFTKMCSGSEAGSYLRLIDFVYHSTLGVRVPGRPWWGQS